VKLIENRPILAFCVVCFIWGTTWLATKVALAVVPPFLFSGTRFVTAGCLMTLAGWRQGGRLRREDLGRLLLSTLLMIVLCYGPMLWGMRFIESGIAAVIEMSLTPVALLFCAVALGEETLTRRKILALVLGIVGVVVMFLPDLSRMAAQPGSGVMRIVGGVAVALSAFTYGLGSVVARPLLRACSPTLLSGLTTLIGGAVLLVTSLLFEPGAKTALRLDWGLGPWMGWLYVTIFGSLGAFVLYMRLLRDLGPSRSGNFAFVSPAIAVIAGALVLRESVPLISWLGMAVMLTAAFISLHGKDQRD
jgi:drug/metabolite transporter (DMT)-like permease